MNNVQLSELAQKAKEGDKKAFEEIYILLSPDVYSIVYEITRDKEEALDLTQDCFLAAMLNISNLKNTEKVKNWLIRIAANKSRDYLKKKKPSVITEELEFIIENIEEDTPDILPEQALEETERKEDLRSILDSLSEDKRLCLLLRYKYEMSYSEIAEELGISESAVKSRLFRAKEDVEKEAEKRKKKGLPLFGVPPFGLVILLLKESSESTAAGFAGSALQAASLTAVTSSAQVGAAATATGATTAASGSLTAGVKIAAMSVAQKVAAGVAAASIVTGSAVGTAVVVKKKAENAPPPPTSYTEEYTTAPSTIQYVFSFETTNAETTASTAKTKETILSAASDSPAPATKQQSVRPNSTKAPSATTKGISASRPSTSKAQTTESVTKPSVTDKKEETSATTKKNVEPGTRKPPATTKKSAENKTTKSNQTHAATQKPTAATTTKAQTTVPTTKKEEETVTEKATEPTTKGKATVNVKVYSEGSGDDFKEYSVTFEEGEAITITSLEAALKEQHGIEAMADNINETAQAGAVYTATAYAI